MPDEASPFGSKPRKTLIIGHQGRMGQMLFQEAQKHGLLVVGIDQPLEKVDLATVISGVELALFCVPALVLEEVLAKICPSLPKTCIVADITSVKVGPLRLMESYFKYNVVGTHPLFGPKFDLNDPLKVAITPGSKAELSAINCTEGFFTSLGFTVFRCEAKQHDLAMAGLQNLNFISNLAYFALLAEHEDLLSFVTPSFKRRLEAAKKMLTEDAEMFTGLFEVNPYSHELVRKYSKILNLAAAGDIELLSKKAKWWWDDSRVD